MNGLEVRITHADNGLIVEWPDELDGGEKIVRRELFEEHEGDGEWAEHYAWQKMLYRLIDILGGPYGSKHDAKRLRVVVEDKEKP